MSRQCERPDCAEPATVAYRFDARERIGFVGNLSALLDAGFKTAEVHRAATLAPEARGPGAGMAHIIEASTR